MVMSRVLASLVLIGLALSGCASEVPTGLVSSTGLPSSTPTSTPTAGPEPAALLLAGDHFAVLSDDGTVLASVTFVEPVAEALAALTELFGEPVAKDALGDQCAVDHRTYTWGGILALVDSTGYRVGAPRDTLPYRISITAAELQGIRLTTSVGLGVGDAGGDYLYHENSGVSAGEFLLEQSGEYLDGPEVQPIGVFAYAEDKAGPMTEISSPATLYDVWHEC